MQRFQGWDDYFLQMAEFVAQKSKDDSTQVGCVITNESQAVVSTGYNGFPRGVREDVDLRHARPEKYFWNEHAERNALYNAARMGSRTEGCTAYLAGIPRIPVCVDCARGLIQAGISRVVVLLPLPEAPIWDRWAESWARAAEMMQEAGLEITEVHRWEGA